MTSFDVLPESVYVWNRENTKSVTTKRDNPSWKTSTIRHYADTLELYMIYQRRDYKVDKLLFDRVKLCEEEMLRKGDRQF